MLYVFSSGSFGLVFDCAFIPADPCALERAFLLLRALLQPDSGSNGGITVADSLLCGLAVAVAPDVAAAVTSYAYVYWKGNGSPAGDLKCPGIPNRAGYPGSPFASFVVHLQALTARARGGCRPVSPSSHPRHGSLSTVLSCVWRLQGCAESGPPARRAAPAASLTLIAESQFLCPPHAPAKGAALCFCSPSRLNDVPLWLTGPFPPGDIGITLSAAGP